MTICKAILTFSFCSMDIGKKREGREEGKEREEEGREREEEGHEDRLIRPYPQSPRLPVLTLLLPH